MYRTNQNLVIHLWGDRIGFFRHKWGSQSKTTKEENFGDGSSHTIMTLIGGEYVRMHSTKVFLATKYTATASEHCLHIYLKATALCTKAKHMAF
mmetsp:Transcript_20842/g.27432  ORF Transcript_20842/g.27432 Transcript_20842/m.27432 type:complete len:94 (+) Transcript_20842:90-371(+)